MASKDDYDKRIDKSAKRIGMIESISAGISAAPDSVRNKAISYAADPAVNRQRAIKKFDRETKERADKKYNKK